MNFLKRQFVKIQYRTFTKRPTLQKFDKLELNSDPTQDLENDQLGAHPIYSADEDPLLAEDFAEIPTKNPLSGKYPISYSESVFRALRDFSIDFRPRQQTYPLDFTDTSILNIFHKEEKNKIPKLNSTLEPMIAHKGIYRLNEMTSRISEKYHKYLTTILQPEQLHLDRIPEYTHPSRDKNLLKFAQMADCKLIMSTSSCSSFLSHIHYVISSFKEPNMSFLKNFYMSERNKFMNAQKKPFSNILRLIDKDKDIWAIDSFPMVFEPDHKILMDMGKILEKVYTMEPDHFNSVFSKKHSKASDKYEIESDYHRYMIVNKQIALRSQIDCQSSISGEDLIFEIKTRACAPIRYDVKNYQLYLDYSLDRLSGTICSYEREFYDLIRGAFLKYYFQLKIGCMDGAFVGYHNTRESFGFEYIKMETIEQVIFGGKTKANTSFAITTKILNEIVKQAINIIKHETFEFVNMTFYADSYEKKLSIVLEPVNYIEYEAFRNIELKKGPGMQNIYDFYKEKVGREKLKAYKIDFLFYPKINDIYDPVFFHNMRENDLIEMEYVMRNIGLISFEEYMNLIVQSFKNENMILDSRFSGHWGNFNSVYTIS